LGLPGCTPKCVASRPSEDIGVAAPAAVDAVAADAPAARAVAEALRMWRRFKSMSNGAPCVMTYLQPAVPIQRIDEARVNDWINANNETTNFNLAASGSGYSY
jgi:hypothetical protein